MFSISSLFKKSPAASAFESLKVDMHSHLIPGIDDGSPDVASSIALLRGLKQLGFSKIITTPHVYRDLYPNDSRGIRAGLKVLTDAMQLAGIELEVEAAAEYFIDSHLETLIGEDDVLSFGAERYVLIEMSFVSASPNLEDVIFGLTSRGYRPILAHPERYHYLMNKAGFYNRLADLGCLLQVNILSLVGYYGKSVQRWAEDLLKSGRVAFLGTDLHHRQHLTMLKDCRYDRRLAEIMSRYEFKNHELLR